MKAATRTKTNERSGPALAVARRTDLFVIIDGDRPLDGGARYLLDGVEAVTLGRGEGAAIRQAVGETTQLAVRLASHHVSKLHADLRRVSAGWELADQGSKNGTFLNDQRVDGRLAVRPGDIIQVGNIFLALRESAVAGDVEVPADVPAGAAAGAAPFPDCPTLVPFFAARLLRLRVAAASGDPVVIVGETGTGKEILARAIHAASGRQGRFVPVNCAELAPSLVEGQLFGYLKGAYSGAAVGDPGYIMSAGGGTLFLDEIPELPLAVQAKLLRVIQEGQVVPLGRTRSQSIDVRFLAATQRRLGAVVEAGQFRADLQARLEHHIAELPTLRERREDLGLLVAAILRRHQVQESHCLTFLPATVLRMLRHAWPLNIRQLDKGLARAVQFSRAGILDERALFQDGDAEPERPPAVGAVLSEPDQREREQLAALLQKHGGNVTAVARELEKHKAVVYQDLDRLDLNQNQFRPRRGR
jgi:hypothetical protein